MQHPRRLGKYDIVGVLGEGAMGVVYKAHDPFIDRQVAIKTVRKALLDSSVAEDMAARFRNEARAAGRLSHPGIVPIYEYGEDDTTAFIAMEFVEGRDLAQILGATPTLPEGMAIRFMQQLLDALGSAHRAGVWHRDIKPANLIVTTDGLLKVMDFGVARIASAALTQAASTIGTPGYMAPEQYIGETIDHRVDLFAAGVLLYRMLSGRSPFAAETPEAVMYKVLHQDPAPLSTLEGLSIAPSLDAVIARALAKTPQARFSSAAEFRDALAERSAVAGGTTADDATVIAAMPLRVRPASPGTSRGPTGSAMPSQWDASSLAAVEAALTRFMGPVARVLVREAARTSADLRQLQDSVSQHLRDPRERQRFEALLSTGMAGGTSAGTRAGSSASATGAVSSAGASTAGTTAGISAGLSDYAGRALARQLGPIAKVVVRKAAASASSRQVFFDVLCRSVEDPARRAQLQAELGRAPDGL